eukprot:747756-Hanusia_phi.AAC.3
MEGIRSGQVNSSINAFQSEIGLVSHDEEYYDSENDEDFVPPSDFSSSFLCKSMLDESDLYHTCSNHRNASTNEGLLGTPVSLNESEDMLPVECRIDLGALHDAVVQNDADLVSELLRSNANVSHRDKKWFCPLHYAAKFGYTDIINNLVRQGNADIESETREGYTALHLATMYDREEAVEALVELLSIDALNLQDQDGKSALHYVNDSEAGDRICSLLLRVGADPNLTDFQGNLPPYCSNRFAGGMRGGPSPSAQLPTVPSLSSVADGDIVTGRGEVWVARPLSPSILPVTDPREAVAAGGLNVSHWGLQTVEIDPKHSSQRASDSHAEAAGRFVNYASWQERSVARFGTRSRMEASVDLTKSMTDDWIVVDSDEEERASSREDVIEAITGRIESQVWKARVDQAKGAMMHVGKHLKRVLGSMPSWPAGGE